MRQLVAMIGESTSGLRAKIARVFGAYLLEERRVERHAVLDDLVEPGAELAARQRRQHGGSMTTSRGWWKAPIRFLPSG